MIKDSISLCGEQVFCYFVSPVDRFNSMWLELLKSCEPEDLFGELEDFFGYCAERARRSLKESTDPDSRQAALDAGKAAVAFMRTCKKPCTTR